MVTRRLLLGMLEVYRRLSRLYAENLNAVLTAVSVCVTPFLPRSEGFNRAV